MQMPERRPTPAPCFPIISPVVDEFDHPTTQIKSKKISARKNGAGWPTSSSRARITISISYNEGSGDGSADFAHPPYLFIDSFQCNVVESHFDRTENDGGRREEEEEEVRIRTIQKSDCNIWQRDELEIDAQTSFSLPLLLFFVST